jgi:ferredoxin/flavodoxin---NADP+ reductase
MSRRHSDPQRDRGAAHRQKAKPGQFVILKANETGERIPLTMAETDRKRDHHRHLSWWWEKSTALFKTLTVGEGYQDVIGPSGKGNPHREGRQGGLRGRRHRGRRAAPHHPGLKEAGNHVTAIIGARTKDLLILEDFG